MFSPRSGSSHYTFRKPGCQPITIPKHEPIKKVYVEWFAILLKVRRIVMKTLEQYMALPYPLESSLILMKAALLAATLTCRDA